MRGFELPFPASTVPAPDGDGFVASDVLFARDRNDRSTARLDLELGADGSVHLTDHACGRQGLQLIKVTGSSFAAFARDEHTTLPERPDRALFTWMDIGWRYTDGADVLEVEGANIGDALNTLIGKAGGIESRLFKAPGQLNRFVNVYLNDEDIRFLKNLETPVKEGDTISIVPAIAGG